MATKVKCSPRTELRSEETKQQPEYMKAYDEIVRALRPYSNLDCATALCMMLFDVSQSVGLKKAIELLRGVWKLGEAIKAKRDAKK